MSAHPALDFDAPIDRLIATHLPAARRGDRDAYARIVVACQSPVTAIALAIVRDVPTSEDIAQEAFLKAWQGLDTLKNHASFLPWLRQITRNLARDYLRAARHRPMTGEGAEVAINIAADPSPSPAQRMLQTEEERAAADIISALPEDSRETLLLYYREGQRSKQVAALLGLSDAAVRKRLSRARAQVREQMLARFGEFARSSAPGAAFTATVIGGLALASPAVSAAAAIGSGLLGGGVGKLGSGAVVGSGMSGGVAGGSLAMTLKPLFHGASASGAFIGGAIGGLAGWAFTLWYMLRFARNTDDRRRIHRFFWMHTSTAAVWAVAMMLTSQSTRGWAPLSAVTLVGLAVMNYQWLVPMQRMMAPMLEDPANRRLLRWYPYMLGRKAMAVASLIAIAGMAWAIWRSGGFNA